MTIDRSTFLTLFNRGKRILSAYTDDRPFSVELVGAVSYFFLRYRGSAQLMAS